MSSIVASLVYSKAVETKKVEDDNYSKIIPGEFSFKSVEVHISTYVYLVVNSLEISGVSKPLEPV